jgi:cell division septal protein FtsQ
MERKFYRLHSDKSQLGEGVYLPEIQRKKLRRRRLLVWGAVLIFLYFLTLGFLWVVLWTPVFRLKGVEISGSEGAAKDELVNLLRWRVMDAEWKHFLGFDNILIWPEAISPEELKYLPWLKSLEIRKDYRGRTIRIAVRERESFGVWCLRKREAPECFWFDKEGVVLARAPLTEGSLIPAVNDYSQDKLIAGGKVLPEGQIPNLFSVLRVLSAARLGAKEIRLDNAALSELKVLTYNGPEIYFSLRFSADNALVVLNSMRAATTTAGLEKLEYIDFRAENRAYYR